MGATVWAYWVPYQADVGAALASARDKAFGEGDYYKGSGRHRVETPTSIADLFARMRALGLDTEGTHSILDMTSIGPEPGFGVVAPLDDDQLDALFGTLTPTRAQVEAERGLIEQIRDRWEGTYVVAYQDGAPSEILFIGVSGD